jgi:uncharacterized Tic20 family protein
MNVKIIRGDTVENFKPWGMEKKTFLMCMHLSQFAGFIIPFGGLILPIIMWQTNKDESQEIDKHGKVILNWVISSLIYIAISFVLTIIVIGVFGLFAVGILAVVFTIIGAIKANEGTLWHYPLSIKFFKV